eukprot:m.61737 g.61737  ORF g.61737 m.61737 type:complete len:75 (+) comp13355_c1_seq1:220-444(+)
MPFESRNQEALALQKTNEQLKAELSIERMKVSEACKSITNYCKTTKDPMIPSIWGRMDDKDNHYKDKRSMCALL